MTYVRTYAFWETGHSPLCACSIIVYYYYCREGTDDVDMQTLLEEHRRYTQKRMLSVVRYVLTDSHMHVHIIIVQYGL